MRTAALIPCRKNSRGIRGKNFRELCGKPLFMWTVDAAVESGVFESIIVSSDGGLDDMVNTADAVLFDNERPEHFATDEAPLDGLLVHYMEQYPAIDIWCLLQPTSPLRSASDIRKAYDKILPAKYDSLVSVTRGTCMYWIENAVSTGHAATYHINKRPNRQDRKGWYRENGAIYFTKKYVLETLQCRLGGDTTLFKMPAARSLELDTPMDWKICEALMNGRGR